MGGGSGGHVMPVVAVIDELAARHPSLEIRFWCDRGFYKQSKSLMRHALIDVKVEKVLAGKFRRYHGTSLLQQLMDFRTLFYNFIDFFIVIAGFFQSFMKLLLWRPQVVFCKGGFVCLPVGFAAHLLSIPLVIHDSDTHPGLTNRLLARYAQYITTGSPLEFYNYPTSKTRYVGIPIKPEFRLYNAQEKARTKKLFNLPVDKPLLVIMGGGLGAKRINDAIVAIAPELVKHTSIVHSAGTKQYEEIKQKIPKKDNYKLFAFLSDHLGQLLGAADVIVTRTGATAMAEMAATGAAVILVPNGLLAGGHQLTNAKVFVDAGAAMMIDEMRFEAEPLLLQQKILQLLNNKKEHKRLSQALYKLAKPQAAKELADIVERAAKL